MRGPDWECRRSLPARAPSFSATPLDRRRKGQP
nr:MAG TPA: hypothetical protein [Caudoviricetes sp.]